MTEQQKIEFVSVKIEHYLDLKRKGQELEKYKKEVDRLNKVGYCYAYEKDCHKICKQQNCMIKNGYKYEQALDEIEEVVKHTCRQRCINECLGTKKHCGYGSILNIINKAKEQ